MRRWWICLPACLLVAAQSAEKPKGAGDPLPEKDPYVFLEKCLQRYDQAGINGYTCLFIKQERIDGELRPTEKIRAAFRAEPLSVFFNWIEGARKASRVLYVQGENDNQMLCRPTGLAGALVSVVSRDPEGPDAKQSGRYSIKTFGMRHATESTLAAWKAARSQGTLKVEYLGVRTVREAGDRPCYALRRTCAKPEEDGVVEGTFYFDKDTWFQVGTVLKGTGGKLIGSYYFRDIERNPSFKPTQFTRAALTE
jgi:Protein of unknown function (DUF1571)